MVKLMKSEIFEVGLNTVYPPTREDNEDRDEVSRCTEFICDIYSRPGPVVGEGIDIQNSKNSKLEIINQPSTKPTSTKCAGGLVKSTLALEPLSSI
jgi:hypothetical protein